MRVKSYISLFLTACLSLSCIQNDLPYPRIVPNFKTINVAGAEKMEIDAAARHIYVTLDEKTDMRHVRVSDVAFDVENVRMTPQLEGEFDLRSPLEFTLSTYQDYRWTLEATQDIEYYFLVENQIGGTTIDAVNGRVVIKVGNTVRLDRIKVLRYKLGPAGISSYSVDLASVTNFTEPVSVDVTVRDEVRKWMIYVEHSDIAVSIKSLDVWTKVAWISAEGVSGRTNGIMYRKAGEEAWTEINARQEDVSGGTFNIAIDDLEPLTAYECRAFSGTDVSETRQFVTEGEEQIPNSGFEIYSNAESDKYYSWWDKADPLCHSKWWDSGNQGSTMVGGAASICAPDTEDRYEGASCARLNSRYVVIKFAAGNLFSGEFAGLEGMSGGRVNFGRPFTLRPRKLSLMLKYAPGIVDNVNGYPDSQPVAIGDMDRCFVFIALGDWDYRKYGGSPDSPVQVNTTRRETFFNPEGENVIGYGCYVSDKATDGWVKVEIPIEYRSHSRVPSHIIISCASSMLGDYFTGSSSSVLRLDAMRLEY